MTKITSFYSPWLTGLLAFVAAVTPLTTAAVTASTTLTSTSASVSDGPSPTSGSDSKRIVQYCGTLYAPSSHNKVHIAQIVNSTREIYATNVLYGTWSIWANKTMTAVRKAGVSVSMFMRGGWSNFNNATTFDTYYGVLRDTLRKYKFDGIDMDIEDYGEGNPHAIGLDAVVRLVRRLRRDFGLDFIITLAPLAGGSNLSKFSYKRLEERCGSDISWYNYQPDELASTDSVDAVFRHDWKPERIAVGMMSTPDFPDIFVELPRVAKTLSALADKYPTLRGVDGFNYYDQKPGGYIAPWAWPQWAAQHVANSTDDGPSPSSGMQKRGFKA
ncbi:hypothetical protein AAE478_001501 [Parahypoxylon ruwenzoriense]